MAEKNEREKGRRVFGPFAGGYSAIAPPGYDPERTVWVPKEPGGMRTGEVPLWERMAYRRPPSS